VGVEEGEEGEEKGEDYGERERGVVGPEVDGIFVELKFWHDGDADGRMVKKAESN
jgi:hypothetical protein